MRTPKSPATERRQRDEDRRRPIASTRRFSSDHIQVIDSSHERCAALGMSRLGRPDFSLVPRADLGVSRERNRRLMDNAAPIMEMLYEQIVDSQSMVVLTDAAGVIIHSTGDDNFLEKAEEVALKPGADWSESSKGTNAIGTALIDERPTVVFADEHYLHANHFLTCSAATILDPRGNILGVLDVSGDHLGHHQHTMALVQMSARMIENRWLSDDHRQAMRLHFHTRPEFIGTLTEGILAVNVDGRIVGANRSALAQLGVSGAALRMNSLNSLFGTNVSALADRFRSPLAKPAQLYLSDGRQFHVLARFDWPVWSHLAEAIAAPSDAVRSASSSGEPASRAQASPVSRPRGSSPSATAEPASADASALELLRSGDTQMSAVVDKLRRVLNQNIPVLILGETGTGKELLARALHADSSRGTQPFVAVNCASIPDTLIEAELFGYEEGAFTGARRRGSVGKIVQASGGTLFLDEIGDMALPLQAHLLRVLQERQVVPLGSTKSIAVDLCIICATHRNLREMIERQQFREDLYYRLNGLAVRLPPLRDRTDLAALVQRILERECNDRWHVLAPDVLDLFHRYRWPGNVRQLASVLRTACVMAGQERQITRKHLSDDFIEEALAGQEAVAAHSQAPEPTLGPAAAQSQAERPTEASMPAVNPGPFDNVALLDEVELAAIRRAVEAAGGNISSAARRLGVSRNTIYRKLRWNAPR